MYLSAWAWLTPAAQGMDMVKEESPPGESMLSQWIGPVVALRTWREVSDIFRRSLALAPKMSMAVSDNCSRGVSMSVSKDNDNLLAIYSSIS